MIRNILIALAAVVLAGCAGIDQKASSPDFSRERLEALAARVRADVQDKRIPGAVMLVARNGRVAYFEAVGMQDPKSGTPMQKDSIFRIYSMTKPIVSVAAMMLVEEGRMQLADPVSKYLPELKGLKVGVETKDATGKAVLELVPSRREMTVQDLLRHTSGIAYDYFGKSLVKDAYKANKVDDWDQTNSEFVQRLTKVPLHHQPGSTWEYSLSTDVLGHLIERLTGSTLDRFVEARILEPLGMKDTAFQVEPAKHGRIAEALASDSDAKGMHWEQVRSPRKRLSAGAALLSTAEDYFRFTQMLLNGGELDGVRLLSRKTVEYMTSDHLGAVRGPAYLPGPGHGFGLGFAVRTAAGESNTPGSVGDYWWGGYGGTYFWVDPKEKLIAIWMMQSVGNRSYYRMLYRTMVYSAMQ